MANLIYPDLSFKISGLCFKVQNKLGRFCKEKQYSDQLERFLLDEKINYKREYELVKLDNSFPGGNRVDFLIENIIIFDTKAKKFITKEDYYQMQRYLIAANKRLGLIVNFRNSYIKPKRIINNKYKEPVQIKIVPNSNKSNLIRKH